MKELSIFIDESGDFGPYSKHSQYYIVSLVIHEQSNDISTNINNLNTAIKYAGFDQTHAIHTGPLIRRESDYMLHTIDERRHLFNCLYNFMRTTNIYYKTITINKNELSEQFDLNAKISRVLSSFLQEHSDYFRSFDKIVLYYDNGQTELTKILVSVFNACFSHVDVRKVLPADYKLFQVADLICTLELLEIKIKHASLSNSESQFFKNTKEIKTYIKTAKKKSFEENIKL